MYMSFLGMYAYYGKLGGKAANVFCLYEFEILPMYLTIS